MLLLFTIWDGVFTWREGIILLLGMVIYLWYTTASQKDLESQQTQKKAVKTKRESLSWKTIFVLLASCVFIFLGAKFTIDSIIELSAILNIGTEIIAMSAVALGTSLPELMVTISAAKQGNAEMAVGNVLGSNIFNSFVVMGVPAFFGSLSISQEVLMFSFPVMIAATLLYFFMTQEKEITKWEGWFLILFYGFFIAKIFALI